MTLPKLEKAGVLDRLNIDSFAFGPGTETILAPFMSEPAIPARYKKQYKPLI
jgi:hypothetical protein